MLLGERMTVEGLIPRMMEEDATAWNAVVNFVETVMKVKEEHERLMQVET